MRAAGVLLHLSSLPGPCGIGTMGRAAFEFVDFLAAAGQSFWQILPLGPTGYGDSPYQSFSTFAGNPYFIDLALLVRDGLLSEAEAHLPEEGGDPGRVDYGWQHRVRIPVLRLAAARFLQHPPEDFQRFCCENAHWLDDYALYMALKDAHGGQSWADWEPALKRREPEALGASRMRFASETDLWKALQYLFFRQWKSLKRYANQQGVRFIGDLPIYVATDSADVWSRPDQFLLDDRMNPIEVAGCPPDGFTADGQLWGNPLYRWEAMQADGYVWWIERLRHTTALCDIVRIDHFRGFDSYYAIPAGSATAREGVWRAGPGISFFREMERALGRLPILAEDLGFLTDSVRQLLAESGYPGMKVLQFAFDSREDSDYLPHNYTRHCVVYTGTHDNDTILGWFEGAS
ncbi:MAG: 4-alpha-glucanotransferase, partial [Oscillospiraceae bacterium]